MLKNKIWSKLVTEGCKTQIWDWQSSLFSPQKNEKKFLTCRLLWGKEWAETIRTPSGSWKNTEEITELRRNWSSIFESQAINRTRKATAECTKVARDFLLASERERKTKKSSFWWKKFHRDKNSLTAESRRDPSCFRHAGLTALATTYLSSTNSIRRLKWSRFQVTKDHVFLFSAQSLGTRESSSPPWSTTRPPAVPGHPWSHGDSTVKKL